MAKHSFDKKGNRGKRRLVFIHKSEFVSLLQKLSTGEDFDTGVERLGASTNAPAEARASSITSRGRVDGRVDGRVEWLAGWMVGVPAVTSMVCIRSIRISYDAFPGIDEEFRAALDESLRRARVGRAFDR